MKNYLNDDVLSKDLKAKVIKFDFETKKLLNTCIIHATVTQ